MDAPIDPAPAAIPVEREVAPQPIAPVAADNAPVAAASAAADAPSKDFIRLMGLIRLAKYNAMNNDEKLEAIRSSITANTAVHQFANVHVYATEGERLFKIKEAEEANKRAHSAAMKLVSRR